MWQALKCPGVHRYDRVRCSSGVLRCSRRVLFDTWRGITVWELAHYRLRCISGGLRQPVLAQGAGTTGASEDADVEPFAGECSHWIHRFDFCGSEYLDCGLHYNHSPHFHTYPLCATNLTLKLMWIIVRAMLQICDTCPGWLRGVWTCQVVWHARPLWFEGGRDRRRAEARSWPATGPYHYREGAHPEADS